MVPSLRVVGQNTWSQTGRTGAALQSDVAVETKQLSLNCLLWPFLFCCVFRWSCNTKPRSLELSATRSSAVDSTMDTLLWLPLRTGKTLQTKPRHKHNNTAATPPTLKICTGISDLNVSQPVKMLLFSPDVFFVVGNASAPLRDDNNYHRILDHYLNPNDV